ncbi:MAG: cyanophycin synthetase [Bacteroidota bacterium]
MTIETLAQQGKNNIYSSMASGITGRIPEIRKETIKESLCDFQNAEHRLEFVAKIHNIEFFNDSKATNVNSTWFALESMNKPVIWIVGGLDKGNDYIPLKEVVKLKVKSIICLGLDNRKIFNAFADIIDTIIETTNAEDAVNQAYNCGKSGDVVLLSPACASFDIFENFEDRGKRFKKAVTEL